MLKMVTKKGGHFLGIELEIFFLPRSCSHFALPPLYIPKLLGPKMLRVVVVGGNQKEKRYKPLGAQVVESC